MQEVPGRVHVAPKRGQEAPRKAQEAPKRLAGCKTCGFIAVWRPGSCKTCGFTGVWRPGSSKTTGFTAVWTPQDGSDPHLLRASGSGFGGAGGRTTGGGKLARLRAKKMSPTAGCPLRKLRGPADLNSIM